MFSRATITLGIGPHSSWLYFLQRQTNVNMTSRDCRRRIGITVTVNGRLNLRLAKWPLIFVGATFLA